MSSASLRWAALLLAAAPVFAQQAATPAPPVPKPDLGALRAELAPLSAKLKGVNDPDVLIYEQAVQRLLAHPEEFYTAEYIKHARSAIADGLARAAELEKGATPWKKATGRVARAYRSRVDDSLQPYRLNIPVSYDGSKPVRLDVVLHGRNGRLTPASFLADPKKPLPAEQTWIELEVYGRVNNAYRWAGETDVFEALAAVRREYKIDPDRIVLRGFSMGGAGTWQIGLHYPLQWAAIEAGAGFTDTIKYAKRTGLTPVESAGIHIYDAVDYAANIRLVPTVGYGGELDPQLKASQNIQEAVKGLQGVDALWLIGPKTEHKFHPDSKKESEAFVVAHLPRKKPENFELVTYTPRYGNGLIEGLERLYEKATLTVQGREVKTANVAILLLEPGDWSIDGQKLKGGLFTKSNGKWNATAPKGLWKRTGLQGPIDDAFMERFVVVGEGPGLAEVEKNFEKFMNGQVLKRSEPTANDIRDANLVLFGDPQSNRTLARVLRRLPVKWTAEAIKLNGQRFDAATHTLALIYPNPLNPSKYVVINSGHTFGQKDFEGTNALLYPRLGDYAVIEKATGAVKLTGFFNNRWQFPTP